MIRKQILVDEETNLFGSILSRQMQISFSELVRSLVKKTYASQFKDPKSKKTNPLLKIVGIVDDKNIDPKLHTKLDKITYEKYSS